MMNKTVFLDKIKLEVFDSVYFPTEDSFLLINAVKIKPNSTVLDLGCGSGVQSINAIQKGAKKVLAIDINPKALKNTILNANKTKTEKKIKTKKSNLFESVKEKFDLIIFNPPYVQSEKIELIDVDGGIQGREILDPFLEEFSDFLNENGKCFFLQSSLNGIHKTEKKLEEKNLEFEIVAKKHLFFEELVVFCVWKKI